MEDNLEVTRHDPPHPALRGWYWRCTCENCEDQVEWNFFGPFKTERQARRDAKRDESKRTAAYCITAAVIDRQQQTADEQLVDLEVVSINARTAEAAAAIELSPGQTVH
jgi:hypothetical protein